MPRTCVPNPTTCPNIEKPASDWCNGGTVIPGGNDAQGCPRPDTCQKT